MLAVSGTILAFKGHSSQLADSSPSVIVVFVGRVSAQTQTWCCSCRCRRSRRVRRGGSGRSRFLLLGWLFLGLLLGGSCGSRSSSSRFSLLLLLTIRISIPPPILTHLLVLLTLTPHPPHLHQPSETLPSLPPLPPLPNPPVLTSSQLLRSITTRLLRLPLRFLGLLPPPPELIQTFLRVFLHGSFARSLTLLHGVEEFDFIFVEGAELVGQAGGFFKGFLFGGWG